MRERKARDQEELIPVEPSRIEYRTLHTEDINNPGALKPTADLVDSIRLYGVLDPIRVEEVRHGTYRILDGARRHLVVLTFLREAIEDDEQETARWETIPAVVEETDPTVGDATRIVGHAVRKSNPIAELEVIEELIEDGHSESEIHRLTKLPVGTIRKRMKLQNLAEPIRDAAKDGRIPPSTAEKIATLTWEQQEGLSSRALHGEKITAEDVKEVRTAVHQSAVTESFVGLEPPEEEEAEEEVSFTPESAREYASLITLVLERAGIAENVSLGKEGKEGAKSAYVHLYHTDPEMHWRLKIERQ